MLKKIILARSYGFCMGVKRAINIAEDTAKESNGENVTILNEIVHNDHVVEKFRREGVGQAFTVEDVDKGTLIISAHGISPSVIENAESRGLKVIDATCPLVTRIYDIVKQVVEQGYHVIHFGDPSHDETEGVMGHAPDKITVLPSREQLDDLPEWKDRKLAMTIQTTSSMEQAEEIKRLAQEKWPHLEIFDTICNATNKRQTAIVDLAPQVDMVLVVGSTTSANSKRLASIANALCGKGILIGSKDDIKEEWFAENEGVEKIGISAGASTPDFLVDDVVARLKEISGGTAEVTEQERRKKPRRREASAAG